jgi:hypothetical protein
VADSAIKIQRRCKKLELFASPLFLFEIVIKLLLSKIVNGFRVNYKGWYEHSSKIKKWSENYEK